MDQASNPLFRHGVLLRREALENGIDDKALYRARRRGEIVRIRHGAYARAQHWRDCDQTEHHRLLTTAVLRIYQGAVIVSHRSAVVQHGGPVWTFDLETVDISHPDGNGRTQGKVHHHCAAPSEDDVTTPDGHRVTSIARTIVQATIQSGRVDVGVALASHFLHEQKVTADDLVAARLDVGETPGALVLRTSLAYADARLESVAEARCWLILARAFPGSVEPQHPILELRCRLDFLILSLGVWVEVDGKEKYFVHRRPGESMAEYLLRERRRENRIRELTGWDVVRLTWADLAQPERVVERIVALADRRRRRRRRSVS